MRPRWKCVILGASAAVGVSVWAQNAALAADTELSRLAASMKPGEIKELKTGNCNHDLFKMWYDWEEDDIKRYGSQKMFNIERTRGISAVTSTSTSRSSGLSR